MAPARLATAGKSARMRGKPATTQTFQAIVSSARFAQWFARLILRVCLVVSLLSHV